MDERVMERDGERHALFPVSAAQTYEDGGVTWTSV